MDRSRSWISVADSFRLDSSLAKVGKFVWAYSEGTMCCGM
jgi:hypothetical protein